ncbi:type II secretion system secretin GspD [Sphingosinicella sp. LHD-64]|uniref:type II secretion system secretin GspD n=1 Tax=Sphingosinicella sp. LHD-64 TaxID=3072139 RepID=UPI0028108A0A|nr:type II secretion system secretin GspD [Sphingosinicella sp. LHD-64]MDQ8755667.1 type II secretion system secretin GspD [Sphingosinicella sp. LHD-64]
MKRFLIALALSAAAVTPVAPASAQYVLNLREADVRAFIQDASRVTGRTMIIDPAVQGRVSVVTERPLSRSEYFELFLSTLRASGYVAVPSAGGALRIQPVAGASASAPLGGSGRASPSGFVTEILRVRRIEAAQAIEALRPLVSRDGSITASRNSIIVSDFADNVRRVRQALAQIDVDSGVTRVVGLDNAGAREIAAALADLAPEGVSVVPIDSANSIALRGDAASVSQLAGIAQDLDRRAASGSEIRVVFLEHADAEQLLPVLQTLLGQTPTEPAPTPQRRGRSPSTMIGGTNGTGGGNRTMTGDSSTATPAPAASGGAPTGQAPIVARNAVVTRFAGANAIVIAATPDVQRTLGEVVRQLDVRRQQVLVEAVIAEISEGAARQLGVQLFLAGLRGSNIPFAVTNYSNIAPNMNAVAGAIAANELIRDNNNDDDDDDDDDTPGGLEGVAQSLTEAAVNSLVGARGILGGGAIRSGNAIFGAIVNAVQADNQSNLLSTPSIMTLDNEEAYFLVGQEIPITTGESLSQNFDNAFRTVQRQNVGITLEVRPQINAGGSIKLDLRQEVSSIAGTVSSANPEIILNKREIETTITVDDGEIVGIGGLLDENDRRTLERVPLLGDIPLIGELFRARSRDRSRTNLMVFIRPTIIRTAAEARAMSARRYDYIRGRQMLAHPDREPSIDELVRDYMGATPPSVTPPQPQDQVVTPTDVPPSAAAPTEPQ